MVTLIGCPSQHRGSGETWVVDWLFIFKVTEPNSIPYRTHPACAKMAAYPDPPPVILLPESIAAQAAYQLRYKNTEYYSWVSSGPKKL